ncbi:hypothetical protein [Merismopedia glauca]|uniref:Uncharacterized protein n=1 Tax=Merismopedia glauca CCAP 1448/3 TaxID=1296344 RepID=A0A2T1C588_9CYAN|nr:hypothetical protein [Merismopedia glauca]PSB03283.1 hypothetical protein C7B64_09315 [Merismopedia glauca CCAP 1448/3]
MINKLSLGTVDTLISPAQCLQEVVETWTNYLEIVQIETTKRREIEARERAILADIEAKRELIIGYLQRSFDERAQNFQSLFAIVDRAIASGDSIALSLALQSIVDLGQSSPFKDLSNLSNLKAVMSDPDYEWEL